MKTDPKNSDYVVEAGATRNYEPWKDKDEQARGEGTGWPEFRDKGLASAASQSLTVWPQVDTALRKREEEEAGNAMKALENRTLDSKREIDIVAALDDLRQLKARHAGISHTDVIAALHRQAAEDAAAFDTAVEAAAASAFRPAGPAGFVRRLEEEEEEEEGGGKRQRAEPAEAAAPAAVSRPRPAVVFVRRKEPEPAPAAAPAALGLLGAYGSSGEESG